MDYSQDILSQLTWKNENPEKLSGQKVKIFYFALSTCAYCKKGLAWIREKNAAFSWIYLDELPIEDRQLIKDWLKQRYGTTVGFPFVIFRMPDKDYVSPGWDPDYWAAKIK